MIVSVCVSMCQLLIQILPNFANFGPLGNFLLGAPSAASPRTHRGMTRSRQGATTMLNLRDWYYMVLVSNEGQEYLIFGGFEQRLGLGRQNPACQPPATVAWVLNIDPYPQSRQPSWHPREPNNDQVHLCDQRLNYHAQGWVGALSGPACLWVYYIISYNIGY